MIAVIVARGCALPASPSLQCAANRECLPLTADTDASQKVVLPREQKVGKQDSRHLEIFLMLIERSASKRGQKTGGWRWQAETHQDGLSERVFGMQKGRKGSRGRRKRNANYFDFATCVAPRFVGAQDHSLVASSRHSTTI